MMDPKIYFNGEIWLIIPVVSLLPLLIWNTGKDNLARVANAVLIKLHPYKTGH